MIVQDFYIPEYDWEVRVYYAVDCYYTGRIMADLRRVGCRGADLMDAFRNMRSCNLNTGITYSNTRDRQTVMVIALTSSPGEFQNSWDHEKDISAVTYPRLLGLTHTVRRRSTFPARLGRRCSR
jgi:hypothetical protein